MPRRARSGSGRSRTSVLLSARPVIERCSTPRSRVDGNDFYEGPVSCVLVGNSGSLKGGVKAFPDATSTDGRLHVAAVSAVGMREWASLMVTAVMRKPHLSSNSEIGDGTEITVTFDKKRRFELDGGVKGKAKKLEFEIRPRSLVVCAPAE